MGYEENDWIYEITLVKEFKYKITHNRHNIYIKLPVIIDIFPLACIIKSVGKVFFVECCADILRGGGFDK